MEIIPRKEPETKYLLVRVVGGELPGATFSQRVGPLKIPGNIVGDEVRMLTAKEFVRLKVQVPLRVKDGKAMCEPTPSTAQIIITEHKEGRKTRKKGADKAPRLHSGASSLSGLFKVAIEIRARSRSASMKGTVDEVLGTAMSIGCTIEGKSPEAATAAINNGKAAVAELFGIDNTNA